MFKIGIPPYLECSTKGDKRFSPFYAKPSILKGMSIEEFYHAFKIFNDGSTTLSWRDAKNKKRDGFFVINQEKCNIIYSSLWDFYIKENPELLKVLKKQTGLSDIFGNENGPCQANELWRIRNENT